MARQPGDGTGTVGSAASDDEPARVGGSSGGSSSSSGGDDWEAWSDTANAEDAAVSLFSGAVLGSAEEAFNHDTAHHGFNLPQYVRKLGLDDHEIIQCINYIRSEIAAGRDPKPTLPSSAAQDRPWAPVQYLKPVLENDALLMHDFSDLSNIRHHRSDFLYDTTAESTAPVLRHKDEKSIVEELQLQNRTLLATVHGLRDALIGSALGHGEGSDAILQSRRTMDNKYFSSYSYFEIHKQMLGDKARTTAYQRAIEGNSSIFKNKTIVDVGCGTGILSLFAARVGAKTVYAVEGSKKMADLAKQVAAENGYISDANGLVSHTEMGKHSADGSSGIGKPPTIVVFHAKMEDLAQPPCGPVDVLISEWMGYALLFESMLDTVLYARDNWLKKGGAILPDIASVYIAAASIASLGLSFWREVHGFKMLSIQEAVHESMRNTALTACIESEHLLTDGVKVKVLDLATMLPGDQNFSAEFELVSTALAPQECHAFALWFDVEFSSRFCDAIPVTLSTSPAHPKTHWGQTLLVLRTPIRFGPVGDQASGKSDWATSMQVRLSMAQSKHSHRCLDISVEYKAQYGTGEEVADSLVYFMDTEEK